MSPARTGLLIIRARCEESSSQPLRAHIRLTTDISAGFEASMTLTQVGAVGKTVDTWLEDILAGKQPPKRRWLSRSAEGRGSGTVRARTAPRGWRLLRRRPRPWRDNALRADS
jgi:hypothetical protein